MATSYPRRDSASGIWKISDITSNIINYGTWPGSFSQRCIIAGGSSPYNATVDYFNISVLGNAADFGDLSNIRSTTGCSSHTRGVCMIGENPDAGGVNVIDYCEIDTLGNFADFGDSTSTLTNAGGLSNATRGIRAGGGTPDSNVMDYITFTTTGNATDFGDLSVARKAFIGTGANPIRGIMGGGSVPGTSNVIDYVSIASAGNAVDFGDLSAAGRYNSNNNTTSRTKMLFGGGPSSDVIEYVTIASTGNPTDFGNLTASKFYVGGTSNSVRVVFAGGGTPSHTNVIEYVTIETSGNGADFGDLTATKYGNKGCISGSHGGIEVFDPRLFIAGRGVGLFSKGADNVTDITYINIPSTGNAIDWGDTVAGNGHNSSSTGGSATRGFMLGSGATGDTDKNTYTYVDLTSKGNAAIFGNMTTGRYAGSGVSSSTRCCAYGGYDDGLQDIIDYVTIASVGNATDFGDLTAARYELGATINSSTRGIAHGGSTAPAKSNIMDYITIASTGDATDFGDLSASKTNTTGVCSPTRGVVGGGSTPSKLNVMEYVTISSTGDVTDFGDMTVSAAARASVCTHTRGVFAGGSTPSASNVIDYITIASTGDGTDFGDLITARNSWTGGMSDSHGGL